MDKKKLVIIGIDVKDEEFDILAQKFLKIGTEMGYTFIITNASVKAINKDQLRQILKGTLAKV